MRASSHSERRFSRGHRYLVHTAAAKGPAYVREYVHIRTHTFYTKRQLEKFHRQFTHPSATKLYDLLRTANTQAVTPETLNILELIAASYEPYHKKGNLPTRFRASLGSEYMRLNSILYISIMHSDGKPVLHLMDDTTRFSATQFLRIISSMYIWECIVKC